MNKVLATFLPVFCFKFARLNSSDSGAQFSIATTDVIDFQLDN